MKTLWSLILIIFLFTIIGCQEDITGNDPVVTDPAVVKGDVSASPTSIIAGGTTTLTYTGSKDVTSVTINGTTVSATSGSKCYTLNTTTTFNVKFIGLNDKTYETSVVVNVAEPILPARTIKLCSKYYVLLENKNLDNGIWRFSVLDEEQRTNKVYFEPDGKLREFTKDGKLAGLCDWNWISEDSIKIGSERYQYTLTDSTLVRSSRKGTLINTYKSFLK